MATAVDFFDRTKFVHKKLSIDVCLVTVDATLKVRYKASFLYVHADLYLIGF